jgi:hypothetical protein
VIISPSCPLNFAGEPLKNPVHARGVDKFLNI